MSQRSWRSASPRSAPLSRSKHDAVSSLLPVLVLPVSQVLGDEAYLQAAVRAGQLVWQRGLLKKGPGLCHGVAGNAYALLRVWKATKV